MNECWSGGNASSEKALGAERALRNRGLDLEFASSEDQPLPFLRRNLKTMERDMDSLDTLLVEYRRSAGLDFVVRLI